MNCWVWPPGPCSLTTSKGHGHQEVVAALQKGSKLQLKKLTRVSWGSWGSSGEKSKIVLLDSHGKGVALPQTTQSGNAVARAYAMLSYTINCKNPAWDETPLWHQVLYQDVIKMILPSRAGTVLLELLWRSKQRGDRDQQQQWRMISGTACQCSRPTDWGVSVIEASVILSRCSYLLISTQLEIPHGHGGGGRTLEIHEGEQGCS